MAASACTYLENTVSDLQAPQSLCWALLGLTAWERRPSNLGQWLKQAYENVVRRSEKAPQLSHLLLAASGRSFDLLTPRTDLAEESL